ncbi:MAG: PepSY-like domain-containing protein [Methylococcaceae bacterium]|nr:PepSY-like domain-containing protein [Methylococcaceae bacterium]
MKKKLLISSFIATLVLPVFSAQAGKIKLSEVPEAVIKSMKVEHPDAKNIKVDKELHFSMVLYEVKYKTNGKKHETLFDPQGKHFGHEEEIEISELPQPIIKTLKQTFKQLSIKDAEKISHPDGRVEYEIDVKGDGEDWELAMSPTGKIWVKERD